MVALIFVVWWTLRITGVMGIRLFPRSISSFNASSEAKYENSTCTLSTFLAQDPATKVLPFVYAIVTPLSIASYCHSSQLDFFSSWQATRVPSEKSDPNWACQVTEMMEGASAVDRSVAESMLTETAFWPIWRDEVKPPCCGFCQLGVPEAKVIYWARTTDAGGPVGPQSIVKDGFTFISPSPYVVFRSIFANDLCGKRAPISRAQESEYYTSTTVAYQPGALSSIIWRTIPGSGMYTESSVAMDFDLLEAQQSLSICKVYSTKSYFTGEEPEVPTTTTTIDGLEWTREFCNPVVEVPTNLAEVDPVFAGCIPSIGAWDPPFALHAAPSLTPITAATTTDDVVYMPTRASSQKGMALGTVSGAYRSKPAWYGPATPTAEPLSRPKPNAADYHGQPEPDEDPSTTDDVLPEANGLDLSELVASSDLDSGGNITGNGSDSSFIAHGTANFPYSTALPWWISTATLILVDIL